MFAQSKPPQGLNSSAVPYCPWVATFSIVLNLPHLPCLLSLWLADWRCSNGFY